MELTPMKVETEGHESLPDPRLIKDWKLCENLHGEWKFDVRDENGNPTGRKNFYFSGTFEGKTYCMGGEVKES